MRDAAAAAEAAAEVRWDRCPVRDSFRTTPVGKACEVEDILLGDA